MWAFFYCIYKKINKFDPSSQNLNFTKSFLCGDSNEDAPLTVSLIVMLGQQKIVKK